MKAYSLYLEKAGQGKPLVFLHGLMGSHRFWQAMVPEFEKRYLVLTPDLLGFGDSPKPIVEYTPMDHITALRNTLSAHVKDGEKLLFVGHSMGAILSINYAIAYPGEVERVVLINPPVFSDPVTRRKHAVRLQDSFLLNLFAHGRVGRMVCWLHETFPGPSKRIAGVFTKELPQEVAEDSLKHTWNSYHGSLEHVLLDQQLADLLRQVPDLPVLLVTSDSDEHVDRAVLQRLVSYRHVTIESVQGGHNAVLKNPQRIMGLIEKFFASNGLK